MGKEKDSVQRWIQKTTLKNETLKKDQFVEKSIKDMDAFIQHAYRVTEQYEQIWILKNSMPKTHVIVQMDFAENFVCHYGEEVQSAYKSWFTLLSCISRSPDKLISNADKIARKPKFSTKALSLYPMKLPIQVALFLRFYSLWCPRSKIWFLTCKYSQIHPPASTEI